MRAVTFITLFLLCMSCQTVRHTTETTSDTTTVRKTTVVPFDTTLIRTADTPYSWVTYIKTGTNVWTVLPDTIVNYDGMTLKYGIDNTGILHQTLSRKNDTIRLRDTFYIPGADTVIREHTVVTNQVEETWYEKLWRQAKDFIIIALILIVLIKLIFK